MLEHMFFLCLVFQSPFSYSLKANLHQKLEQSVSNSVFALSLQRESGRKHRKDEEDEEKKSRENM